MFSFEKQKYAFKTRFAYYFGILFSKYAVKRLKENAKKNNK